MPFPATPLFVTMHMVKAAAGKRELEVCIPARGGEVAQWFSLGAVQQRALFILGCRGGQARACAPAG